MFHIEIGNVEGRVYKEFIDLAASLSDKFLLVERNDMNSSDNLIKVLKKLESSLIDMKEQSEWPSAMLTELPEDLCFINGDESWISTSSHEGHCDIISEDEDIIDSILRIKGVEKRFC